MRITLTNLPLVRIKITGTAHVHPLLNLLDQLNSGGVAYTVTVTRAGGDVSAGPVYWDPRYLIVRTSESPPTLEVIDLDRITEVVVDG